MFSTLFEQDPTNRLEIQTGRVPSLTFFFIILTSCNTILMPIDLESKRKLSSYITALFSLIFMEKKTTE